jgi:AraC-like DNA-binding protein
MILRPILVYFAHEPGKLAKLLHRNNLTPALLEDPYAAIPLAHYLRVMEEAAIFSDDPFFGARLGFATGPGSMAAIGIRAALASTIRRAFTAFAQYFSSVQSDTQVILTESQEHFTINYDLTAPPGSPLRQDAEFSLGCYCRLIRDAFDRKWRPVEIRFKHPAPPGRQALVRLFGAPVLFSQLENSIVMRNADADTAVRVEDPDTIAVIEHHLRDQCREASYTGAWHDQVEALISIYIGTRAPAITTVAAALQISPRSLQRKLADEGYSFRELVGAVRQRRAESLLRESSLSQEAIATSLGYADAAAFWRAFRKLAGKTPGAVRKEKDSYIEGVRK